MGYTYDSLRERDAGRKAIFEAEASQRAEVRAEDILQQRTIDIEDQQDALDVAAAAKQRGIEIGSSAGAADTARMFAKQGFIPPHVAESFHHMNQQTLQMDDESVNRGLGMQAPVAEGAVEAQANDISDQLLEATMQGAPDEEINATIDSLQVSPQIKMAAAKAYLSKKQAIVQQSPSGNESGIREKMINPLPGSAVERMASPVTRQAQGIMGETDERIAALHSLMSQQQQPQQPQK